MRVWGFAFLIVLVIGIKETISLITTGHLASQDEISFLFVFLVVSAVRCEAWIYIKDTLGKINRVLADAEEIKKQIGRIQEQIERSEVHPRRRAELPDWNSSVEDRS